MDKIKIFGARVHNLKNINVVIPKNKLVVFTGLSGSGKSSLAFDTIYAEGQRRYVESLSIYARQFLASKEKAEVDRIDGLAPAIAIDQRAEIHNPRSTVGTMTEIYDYLRIFFANLGRPHCPKCGLPIEGQTVEEIAQKIIGLCQESQILMLAPLTGNKKGRQRETFLKIKEAKFNNVRIDGYICSVEQALEHNFDEDQSQTIEVIVDRIMLANNRMAKIDCHELKNISHDRKQSAAFYKLLNTALDLGNGMVVAYDIEKQKDYLFSQNLICAKCKVVMDRLEPAMFSFNSPRGACHACGGLGTRMEVDLDLVMPNKELTILEGAIRPWSRISGNGQAGQMKGLEKMGAEHGFSLNTPLKDMTAEQLNIILYGGDKDNQPIVYEGVANNLLRRLSETNSDYLKLEIEKYMRVQQCRVCQGQRLEDKILLVKVGDKSISQTAQMTLPMIIKFLNQLKLEKKEKIIAQPLVVEINNRLQLMIDIGLDYLTVDRSMVTVSGGEVQKIRLASQIGSNLTGVIYILDEPSIGLHERDNKKLIRTLRKLKELGNTVIVVEHDASMIRAADWVIDIGPGAGKHGGEIVAEGKPDEIKKNSQSLTGQYLCGKKKINFSKKSRTGNGKYLEVIGASEFNLKNIDVKIPLGRFVCITGVSGSGKSTLMTDILSRALNKYFYRAKELPGKYKEIRGLSNINKVVTIDQSPIGRTPRSNPATYTGVFSYMRELFAAQPEARIKGFDAGHFSFNARGGRCETCQGDGEIKIEMHFLSDIYVECEQCGGKRYNSEALEIYWRGKNIAQVLEMNVEEALEFFQNEPQIKAKLDILNDVGLGYIRLGQPAPTLSGGEAQRVKLSTELSRRATGKTLYILDEPTIGLHFDDVSKLLGVLNRLADMGNTILVIEHNLDVIRSADYIIDLGPEGGDKGGEIVAVGTPAEVAKVKNSYTGQYLRKRELADKYE